MEKIRIVQTVLLRRRPELMGELDQFGRSVQRHVESADGSQREAVEGDFYRVAHNGSS